MPQILSLFVLILVGKSLGKAVTWTGLGSIDKSFGLLFGIFKGYIVSICLFCVFVCIVAFVFELASEVVGEGFICTG